MVSGRLKFVMDIPKSCPGWWARFPFWPERFVGRSTNGQPESQAKTHGLRGSCLWLSRRLCGSDLVYECRHVARWSKVAQGGSGGAEWCRVPSYIPHTERQDETVACIWHAYFVFLVQPFNIINLNMRARFMHTSLGQKGGGRLTGGVAWPDLEWNGIKSHRTWPKMKCEQNEHVILKRLKGQESWSSIFIYNLLLIH